jgi:biopolymer transport protein ExbD/biopolymer transport protein TolR
VSGWRSPSAAEAHRAGGGSTERPRFLKSTSLHSGIEVDVPKTKSVKESVKDLPIVKLTGDGEIYLNEKRVNINELGSVVKSRYRGQAAYLKADKAATWELVAQVMSALGDAGIQVNAVTQPEDSADKRGR